MRDSPRDDRNEPDSGDLRGLRPFAMLFGLLCIATFFEGFDTKLVSLVQPVVGPEFGASTEEVLRAVGLSSSGMVLAFFVILLADRIGRRPVFLVSIFVYAILTLATAFAPNLATFTILQVFARMAMVVELGLAYVILSEELPAAIRGRVNGLFASTAVLGASVPAALLAPLEALGVGWRGLFWIGSIPLLLFPFYYSRIRETRVFTERPPAADDATRAFFASALALWRSGFRGRLIRVSGIWLVINFWSGTALYSFTVYTFGERGWNATDLQWLPWGTIPFGLAGYAVSGFVMDRLGRRRATSIYLIVAFFATVLCYGSSANAAIYLGYFLLIGLGGVWTIVMTWTTELFPTEMRATALGLSNNLLGRLGLVVGPILAGRLTTESGSTAWAVLTLSVVTLLALPLVFSLPETNGVALDGIERESAPDETSTHEPESDSYSRERPAP